MPRHSRRPTLYNNCLKLSLATMRRRGHLLPGRRRMVTYSWSRGGDTVGSISATVDMALLYVELDYTTNGKPMNYRVELVPRPSNLGKGEVLYFKCPVTGLLCRKLYCIGGMFVHRKAYRGILYEKQTQSHSNRSLDYSVFMQIEELERQIYSKGFRQTYAGKPTKRYEQILKKLERLERTQMNIKDSIVEMQQRRLHWK